MMRLFPAYAEAGRSFHGSRRHVGAIRTTKTRGKGIPQTIRSGFEQFVATGSVRYFAGRIGRRSENEQHTHRESTMHSRYGGQGLCGLQTWNEYGAWVCRGTACRAPTLRLQACTAVEQTRKLSGSLRRKRGYETCRNTGQKAEERTACPQRDSSLTLGRHSSTIILRRICILLVHSRARTTPWHKYRNRQLP